jgi:membrane associated rhomboid family serine protease
MASEGPANRTRVKALIAGFAVGLVAMPVIAWLVGNLAYGVIAGLMTGAALAAIFQDRVSRRCSHDTEEAPPQ